MAISALTATTLSFQDQPRKDKQDRIGQNLLPNVSHKNRKNLLLFGTKATNGTGTVP
jgi:magnesium-transporting ATPase (P-type)